MADIVMCHGKLCPQKEQCWRYLAPANPYGQGYSIFYLKRTTDKCDFFWQAKVDPDEDQHGN